MYLKDTCFMLKTNAAQQHISNSSKPMGMWKIRNSSTIKTWDSIAHHFCILSRFLKKEKKKLK